MNEAASDIIDTQYYAIGLRDLFPTPEDVAKKKQRLIDNAEDTRQSAQRQREAADAEGEQAAGWEKIDSWEIFIRNLALLVLAATIVVTGALLVWPTLPLYTTAGLLWFASTRLAGPLAILMTLVINMSPSWSGHYRRNEQDHNELANEWDAEADELERQANEI